MIPSGLRSGLETSQQAETSGIPLQNLYADGYNKRLGKRNVIFLF